MKTRTARITLPMGLCLLLVAIGSLAIITGLSFAQPEEPQKPIAELLPAETILYARFDGSEGHQEAYEQTAAYQALEESGLMDSVEQLLLQLEENEQTRGLSEIVQHLRTYGLSMAIAVDASEEQPVQVWGTIVVPEAGEGSDLLESVVIRLSEEKADVRQAKVEGRSIRYVDLQNPMVELGWWPQGNDLVLAFGMNAIGNAIAIADGKRANITTHRLWNKSSSAAKDVDVTQLSWLDLQALREMFGSKPIPMPNRPADKQPTVNNALTMFGLHNLNDVVFLHGYRGESLWTELRIDAPGEKTGLLSLLDQESLTLDDLPAMPLNHSGIVISSFDWGNAYESILGIVREFVTYGPPDATEKLDGALAKFQEELGFAPEDLLSSLDHINCLYSDTTQGIFGLGSVAIVSVKNQDQLTDCIRKTLIKLSEEVNRKEPGAIDIEEIDAEEATQFQIHLPQAPVITPTLSIDDRWMILGLVPQAVEAQYLRQDGTLYSWAIEDDLEDALEQMPEEFTSLQVIDPAGMYKLLLGLAPTFLNLAELGMKENGDVPPDWKMPIDASALPPAEVVVQDLFMNVAMTTVDENGWQFYSRQSLPGLPLPGSAGGGTSIGATGVLAALLLPAVQSARKAARRAQSMNNLKMMGLALHNYHDVFGHFPEGTVPNDALQPDERLSWLVSILPYLEQGALYNSIDRRSGWKAKDNTVPLSTPITSLQIPGQPEKLDNGFGATQYIGIGGLGKDGPTLPVTDKRAGVFAYNRATSLRDIRDGTSNTIMTSEASNSSRWGEGGSATIRAFTAQPYINGPDGIGSPFPGGANMGFADGSVRFISENIDPKTLEALTTINGGEVIGDF